MDIVEEHILRVAETIGSIIEFWGFKRAMGRIWAVLYLSQESMPAAEIGAKLSMSAGSVSMTLQELMAWGVVKKAWRPGQRKEFYEAEMSIWTMVARVVQERELQMLRSTMRVFEEAIAVLKKSAKEGSRPVFSAFAVQRIEALLSLAKISEKLLMAAVAGRSISPLALKKFIIR